MVLPADFAAAAAAMFGYDAMGGPTVELTPSAAAAAASRSRSIPSTKKVAAAVAGSGGPRSPGHGSGGPRSPGRGSSAPRSPTPGPRSTHTRRRTRRSRKSVPSRTPSPSSPPHTPSPSSAPRTTHRTTHREQGQWRSGTGTPQSRSGTGSPPSPVMGSGRLDTPGKKLRKAAHFKKVQFVAGLTEALDC